MWKTNFINHQNKRRKSREKSYGQLLFSDRARDKGFSVTTEHWLSISTCASLTGGTGT